MTAAERPLQSCDRTIRRVMPFIPDGHPEWFKEAPEALVDECGQARMPLALLPGR